MATLPGEGMNGSGGVDFGPPIPLAELGHLFDQRAQEQRGIVPPMPVDPELAAQLPLQQDVALDAGRRAAAERRAQRRLARGSATPSAARLAVEAGVTSDSEANPLILPQTFSKHMEVWPRASDFTGQPDVDRLV